MLRMMTWAFALARLRYLQAVKRRLMAACGPWEIQQEVSSLIMRWAAREREWRDWSAREGTFTRLGRAFVNDPELVVGVALCSAAATVAVLAMVGAL